MLVGPMAIAQSHPMTGGSVGPSGTVSSDPYGYGNRAPGGPEAAEYQLNKDRAFLKKALEEDSTEVGIGELAQKNSSSDDVKQMAQKIIADHKQLGSQIESVAKQLGVDAPKDQSRKEKQLLAKLQGLSGQQFDEEFIKVMLKDHQQNLKDFLTEAEKTQNTALGSATKDGANLIAQHIQLIQQIAQSHNLTADGKPK
jgi:putative membrane protein